jgi:anti-anti-sigma factor
MEMITTKKSETVAILCLQGKLDGSNYLDLINEAEKLYESGVRNLVLDLTGLTFMSSAGISALHRVSLIFRGEIQQAREEEGWDSYRAIVRDRTSGLQEHLKLLNPTEKVQQTLDLVGFAAFFDVHTDPEMAIASFG